MYADFMEYLSKEGKSPNTVDGYTRTLQGFVMWFDQSKGVPFSKIHRENVIEYVSFLKTVKMAKPKTINTKLNALVKFNHYLIEKGVQSEMAITKKDFVKVQHQYASLAKVTVDDVETFRQLVLESGSKRNYAIVTILAYAGLRISEALNLRMDDFNLISREIVVKDGKGAKTRIVYMSEKVKETLQSWLKIRNNLDTVSDHLFISNRGKQLDRTNMNKIFKDVSQRMGKEITPHDLRHFFCSHAIKSGMSIHEVANQAGHSNIKTTLLYTNPSKSDLIEKMNQL